MTWPVVGRTGCGRRPLGRGSNWFPLRLLTAVTALALLLAGCSSGATGNAAGSKGTGTVFTWAQSTGPFVNNFTPFSPDHAGGGEGLIYEPLMMPDVHTDSERPWLATSYRWSDGGRELILHLRSGVKWSNGRPFSASDVAFTFNLMRTTPGLNLDAIPLVSAKAIAPLTAELTFSRPAYEFFDDIVNTTIKPAFIFGNAKHVNPTTFVLKHPVGTGPYLLKSFSPEVITYVRNPLYWNHASVRIETIRHLAFDSQASLLEAIEAGKVSLANLLMPETERKQIEAHFSFLKFYIAPIVVTPLLLNLQDYPFDIVAVRKAISDALDREQLTQVAAGGVYFPATSPTGIDPTTDGAAIAPQYRNLSFTFSPARARSLLEGAGFRMGPNGIFLTPKGKPFSFSILVPSTFVNYLAIAESMVGQLRQAGIALKVTTASNLAVQADIQRGDFQATFAPELSENTPSAWYGAYLDTSAYRPIGTPTETDLERLQGTTLGTIVQRYVGTEPGTSSHVKYRTELESYMVRNLPVIPVFVNTDMGDYNTAQFHGWPSASHPYADPAPLRYNLEEFLTHLIPGPGSSK